MKCIFPSENFSLRMYPDLRNVAPLNADLEILSLTWLFVNLSVQFSCTIDIHMCSLVNS